MLSRWRKVLATVLAVLTVIQPSANAFASSLGPVAPPPSVIHIVQDIHAHAEAQRDIAATLERLRLDSGGRLRVGVEGAAGPFNFRPYHAFPDAAIRGDVARELLDENKIAGPVFSGLTKSEFELEGIESAAQYVANVDAYRRAAPLQKAATQKVRTARRDLNSRKAALFSAPLARLDAAVAAYRAGQMPLGDYLESISDASGDDGLAVETFLAAHRMERAIDFAKVESEKRRFLERLVGAFDAADVQRVRDWVLSASSEGVGAGRRFDFLFHAARAKGVDPRAFPALSDYVRYLHLADAVDADRLFAESSALERTAFARLCASTPGADALVAADRRLFLTEKILRFELTREEWTDYRDARPAGPVALSAAELAPFEDFYRIAEARDAELAANVRRSRVSAIVVGGFHTTGLARVLRNAGLVVDIIRPKISSTAPDQPTAYLSGFAAQKTPLERLFTRWKLFLALPAVIGVEHPLVPSVNDDGPQLFVEKYERNAAAHPELKARVHAASTALLSGRGDDVAGALADIAGRFESFRRTASRSWVRETGLYFAPLVIGLASGNGWLIALGIVVQLFVLPAAHHRTDADAFVQRFVGRTAWSGAFLAIYGAAFVSACGLGAPVPVAAVLALAAPAYLHWKNYRAILSPESTSARFLNEVLGLPRLAMSTGGGPEFTAAEAEMADRVSAEARAAIAAWRALPNKMTSHVATDPVTEVLQRLHAEAEAGANADAMSAMAWGFTQAMMQSNLKPAEMQVRASRDQVFCFTRGIDLSDLAERLNNRMIPAIYYQLGALYVAVAPDLVDAIRRGTSESFTEATNQLMGSAIALWRYSRADASIAEPDHQVRRVWAYVRNLVGKTQPELQPLLIRGATQAMIAAALTPAEVRERTATDYEDEFESGGNVIARAYQDLAAEYSARRRTENSAALVAGLNIAGRATTRSAVLTSLAHWRASNTNPAQRDASMIATEIGRDFADTKLDGEKLELVVAGFADAYATLANSPDDLAERVSGDILLASAFWFKSGFTDDRLLRSLLRVHRAVAAQEGPAVGVVVHRAIRVGWEQAMRRQVNDLVKDGRTRSVPPHLSITILPEAFVHLAQVHQLEMGGGAEAFATGLLDAGVNEHEAAEWVKANLDPALAGPFNDEGLARLRLVDQTALLLVERVRRASTGAVALRILGRILHGPTNGEVSAAIGALTDIPEQMKRALTQWKTNGDHVATADDVPITATMLRLAGVTKLVPNEAETFGATTTAIYEVNLTPVQLQVRVKHDVAAAIARFNSRPLLPEMEIWENKLIDPDLRALANVYLNLSERYYAEGDHERSHAVLSAMIEACRDAAALGPDEVHGRSLILFINLLNYACIHDDAFDLAVIGGGLILHFSTPSMESLEVIGWVYDVMGEANRHISAPGLALRHGFEHTTLTAWKEVIEDFHTDAKAASVVVRMFTTAKLLFQTGAHSAARVYLEKARDLLAQRPKVRALVSDDLVDKIVGLEAAARMVLDRDDAALPERMATVEATLGRLAGVPNEDREEEGFILAVIYEMNIEMCRTGDESRLQIIRMLGDQMYHADKYRQVRIFNLAKSIRLLAEAHPADRAKYEQMLTELYEGTDPTATPIQTTMDSVYVGNYALARAALGHLTDAIAIFRAQIDRMGTQEFIATAGPEVASRMRATSQLELAGILSAAGAAPDEIAPLIAEGLSVEVGDERTIFSTQRLIDQKLSNTETILAAVGQIVTAPEKANYPVNTRVNAAVFARTLAPQAFPAQLETWTRKSNRAKAIKERFDLIDSIASSPWPGRQFALIKHPGETQFHERLYRESLAKMGGRTGVPAFEEWEVNWAPYRQDMWLYAGGLARLGLVDESLQVLRMCRTMAGDALKRFAPGKKLSGYAEDPGFLAFSYSAGDYRAALREGTPIFQSNDARKIRYFGPMLVLAAQHLGEVDDWKSDRDFSSAADTALRMLQKIDEPGLRPMVDYVQSRLQRNIGRIKAARESLQRAVSNKSTDPDAIDNATRAHVELARYSLWESGNLISQRLTDAEKLIATAKERPGYDDAHGDYVELVLSLFQFDPVDPAACARVADRALAILEAAIVHKDLSLVIDWGLAYRLADISLLARPDTAARIGERLAALDEWSGGRAGSKLSLARAAQQRLNSDPRGFLDWTGTAQFPKLPAADVNLWRVAAAQRTGDRSLIIAELLRLVTARAAYQQDSYHQSYVVELLMDSPVLRRSFLDAVNTALGTFGAADWKGKSDHLRRVLEIAIVVADRDFVYLLDALAENKEFPLRSVLNGPEGLFARIEPLLTIDQWAERIILMDAINHDRSIQLRTQAIKVLGADATGPLDQILQQKRFGPEALARIARAITAARGAVEQRDFAGARAILEELPQPLRNADVISMNEEVDRAEQAWEAEKKRSAAEFEKAKAAYNSLNFEGARNHLASMHRDLRTPASAELYRRNAPLLAVWNVYQTGDFDGALRRVTSLTSSTDPVPTILRRRIENMALARRRLNERRPQEAEIILGSMNGNTPDARYDALRQEVTATNERANAAFVALRDVSARVGTSASAIDEIREGVRAVMAIDQEYETVMQFVIEKAQLFYDRRDFRGAQDVLFILISESSIFDTASDNHAKFDKVRKRLERLRSLARAHEMRDWLTSIARLLRIKLDAETHAAERSALPHGEQDSSLKGQTFVFGPSWKLDKSGNVIIEKLAILQTEDGRAARFGDEDAIQRALPVSQAPFQPNLGFQMSFGTGENVVRLPVSFVRKTSTGDHKLIFLPDATGQEILRELERKRIEGRLTFMPDISTLTQVSALNITLGYIDRHIQALSEGRNPPSTMPVIGRLLGLDVSPQVGTDDAPVPQLSAKFEGDPSQTAAILAALRRTTQASAFQGPPGTGKTTTAVEIIRHLVRPSAQSKGRIVVVTAQAHAGVDNIALKIQEANVAIVRSASGSAQSTQTRPGQNIRRSESAQQRVTRKLQTTERERLERLMDALENHHATGTGFAYCVTNNGLRGDRRCFDLLTIYLSGESMNEVRIRFSNAMRSLGGPAMDRNKLSRAGDDGRRTAIQPVWAQEEAGQANPAETLAVPIAINADAVIAFGDQNQLSPGKFDERSKRLIRQEVNAGMILSWGPLQRVLSRGFLAALETSLFEEMYRYAVRWAALVAGAGAGVITGFLAVSRRSHWVIVASIVNVYYGDRLRHRDQDRPRNRWERIRKDTVVFVNSDGREEMDAREKETDFREDNGHGAGNGGGQHDSDSSKSKRNFGEVGEVVRAATYHLNSRSARDNSRRKAGDVLILTPYKAQNRLINETLRWVAIANDYARREPVSSAEIDELAATVLEHIDLCRSVRVNPGDVRRLLNQLRSTPSHRRGEIIEHLYDMVRPIYDLRFNGARTIGRADLPEIKSEVPDEELEPADEALPEEESLDEQEADVIEAKTVHRVQGQERKVVIVSLVRSKELGFLDGEQGRRIINVATSRVEENLVLVYSRGMRPKEVGEMEKRLEHHYANENEIHTGNLKFNVLDRFPSDAKSLAASLRLAWGISTGSEKVDQFIDDWAAPPAETIAFLTVLGLGLMGGNVFMIVGGLLIKTALFPALHGLPAWLGLRPPTVDVIAVTMLSVASALLYVVPFIAFTLGAGLPSSSAFWLSMVAPVILHLVNNRQPIQALTGADLGETRSLELDTIAGIDAKQSERTIDQMAPPVKRAPVFNYGSPRPVDSGA